MGMDPVTVGMVSGAAISAIGSIMKGNSEATALNYQADIQERNAAESRVSAKKNADRQQIIANQHIGDIKAGYAASGVESTSGSVLAVLGASAQNSEMDRQNIIHGGELRAINYENQASLDRTSASNAKTGSYYSAAASVIGAGAMMYARGMGPTATWTGQTQDEANLGYEQADTMFGDTKSETMSASQELFYGGTG